MPTERPDLPASNADDIARRLVLKATDLDGSGLVDVLRQFLVQAEELQRVHERAAAFDQNPPADPVAERQVVLGAYQEALYEPICIEWFLSRAMKEISEHLEFRVYQSQQRLRPLAQVTYTESGQVESYKLHPPAHASE
jgi:hypothetical protein